MTLRAMRKAVFAHKPIFARLIRAHGRSSVFGYYTRLLKPSTPALVPLNRKRELITEVKRQTTALLGKKAGVSVADYLSQNYLVSTAAHHDFATHPFFAHHIVAAALTGREQKTSVVPVLSCAGISLNNSSFPRGLLFHHKDTLQRLNLVSLQYHQRPVYGAKGYRTPARTKALANVDQSVQKLLSSSLPISNSLNLETQITRTVHALYRSLQSSVIYLPQERIATALLMKQHLTQKTIINAILFDPKVRTRFIKEFSEIQGGGTALFWAIENNKRLSLRVDGTTLASTDKTYNVRLSPATLKKELRAGRLMPAMTLTLTLLSFYYGLTCGGGFSQVNYLTHMRAAYLRILKGLKRTDEYAIVQQANTDIFTGEFAIATVHNQPATGLDMMTRADFTPTKLLRLLKTTTLAQAVDRMIPELYKIVSHEK